MNTIIYSKANNGETIWQQSDRLTVIGASAGEAKNNNASRAILSWFYPIILRRERYFGHLKEVWLPLRFLPILVALICGLRHLMKGGLKINRIEKSDMPTGLLKYYIVVTCHSKKSNGTQRDFYPPYWSALDLLTRMDKANIKYLLLRWPLKVLADTPMEHIDILISNEGAPVMREMLAKHVGIKSVDLYTVNGSEVGRRTYVAYFPPVMAEALLSTRQPLSKTCGFIPSDSDQFKCLAYHAVFEEWTKSGLQVDVDERNSKNGEFYDELKRLRDHSSIACGLSLMELVDYLRAENWLPPMDMIVTKSYRKRWLRDVFDISDNVQADLKNSYFVFILRDVIKGWDELDELREMIENDGFSIMIDRPLSTEERSRVELGSRGGNWSAGPWQSEGGKPYHLMLVSDSCPLEVSRSQKTKTPAVINARILRKGHWRRALNERRAESDRANFIHTSDNNRDTIDYLNLIDPSLIETLH